MPDKLTAAFRIVLDEPPPRVVPPLKIKVEHRAGVCAEELPVVERELQERRHRLLKIRLEDSPHKAPS